MQLKKKKRSSWTTLTKFSAMIHVQTIYFTVQCGSNPMFLKLHSRFNIVSSQFVFGTASCK